MSGWSNKRFEDGMAIGSSFKTRAGEITKQDGIWSKLPTKDCSEGMKKELFKNSCVN
jgi:hypothetical protein